MREAPFTDRTAAGRALGDLLAGRRLADAVVLGIARGGVVVAAEVARVLEVEVGTDLDVLVVRKLGHPWRPELGLGALAEGGEPVYDDAGLAVMGLTRADLADVVEVERAECLRRVQAYRGGRPASEVADRTVVVVDDGIATGVTARAALQAVQARGPARLVLAAPVASSPAIAQLEQYADEVVVALVPAHLSAVSRWYEQFDQTPDDEVVRLLAPDG